jgi:hypothetical protein
VGERWKPHLAGPLPAAIQAFKTDPIRPTFVEIKLAKSWALKPGTRQVFDGSYGSHKTHKTYKTHAPHATAESEMRSTVRLQCRSQFEQNPQSHSESHCICHAFLEGSKVSSTMLISLARFLFAVALMAASSLCNAQDAPRTIPRSDGKPADMTKPVQVFILLGQSNMVGLGKVSGSDVSLEYAVKEKQKYQYLVDNAGTWVVRNDVRYVQYMSGKGPLRNEWMTVTGRNLGPEYGIGHTLGNAIDAPVMILKCCIGNRALGWDLLPPGSERTAFTAVDKTGAEQKLVYAGYGDKPEYWPMNAELGLKTEPAPWLDKNGKPIDWYAGKQWDTDIGDARRALADLEKHYPGATGYEIAGFFFWQGERDAGNAGHAAHYEKNLVAFIKALRQEFKSPEAKFVCGTLGEAAKGGSGPTNLVLQGHLAVDGTAGKYPEFSGNVAAIYTHPLAQGGSGNGHYGGKAEVYMDVGEAMGQAMVQLLKAE